jgi:hypothetical protein
VTKRWEARGVRQLAEDLLAERDAARREVERLTAEGDEARREIERLRAALIHRCAVQHVEAACPDCQEIVAVLGRDTESACPRGEQAPVTGIRYPLEEA